MEMGHVYSLVPVPLPETEPPVHAAELFGFRLLHRGHLCMSDFGELLSLLAGACAGKRRRCADNNLGERERASFSIGAFTQGGVGGILRSTRIFPWTAKLLTAIVRGACFNHQFSAVAAHKNTFMEPHIDVNNSRHCPNLILPCSRWQGGGIWVAEDTGLTSLPSANIQGRVYAVRFPYVLLDPHFFMHSTQRWRGDRIILVAYAVRQLRLLKPDDTLLLESCGFSVRYADS